MLEPSTYMDALHRDAAALAESAAGALDAPVPSCPGWTMATLLTHLTSIYAHRIALVRSRARQNTVRSYDDLALPSAYREWFEAEHHGQPQPGPAPDGLFALFSGTAATLEELLRATDPREPVWTWWPPDQTVGFWQRRMAHETAVHRWDAQLARGRPEPIESDLAADGIDEVLDVMMVRWRGGEPEAPQGSGETYHFHRTDGPGEWLVRFAPDGPVVTRQHARGDIAARGTASDLLLFLWHRIPAERLEVHGEAALLDRYFALVPPH